jgi:hypothetical protein
MSVTAAATRAANRLDWADDAQEGVVKNRC